jgi:4-amino-4-deoxy-L-arabinose transferase-like glycosyltransferase
MYNTLKRVKTPVVKGFIFIFVLAFIIRLTVFIFLINTDIDSFTRSGDSNNYINAAINLINNQIFCDVSTQTLYSGIFRTPGYPLFLIPIYYITDYSNIAVILIQTFLSAITCGIVFIIAIKYFSKFSAYIATLFIVFDIASINVSNIIITETFFTFLLTVFIFLFLKFLEENNYKLIILIGLLSGFIALVKPIFLYSFIIMFIVFLLYFKNRLKLFLKYFLLYFISFSLLIVPWLVRNKHIGYSGFSAVQEFNIYNFKSGWIEERLKGNKDMEFIDYSKRKSIIQEAIEDRGLENTAINRVKLYKEFGYKTIIKNPVWLLKYQLRYTLQIFKLSGFEKSLNEFPVEINTPWGIKLSNIYKKIYEIFLYILYALVLTGLFRKKSWKTFKGQIFVVAILFYFIAISGEYGGGSRFRVPMLPLMAIIAAGGLDAIKMFIKKTAEFIRNRGATKIDDI